MSTKRHEVVLVKADEAGQFSAIVSPFGGPPDAQGDVIADTAYDRFIAEWRASGAKLPVIDGHDERDSTADIGWVEQLEPVAGVGLYCVGQLDLANERARYAQKLMRERRRVQFSIGYGLYPGGLERQRDGSTLLTAIRLREISLVLEGAARTELLAVKSAEAPPRAGARDEIAELESWLSRSAPEPQDFRAELAAKFDTRLVDAVFGDTPADRAAAAREAERAAAVARFESENAALMLSGRLPSEAEREARYRDAAEHERRKREARERDSGGSMFDASTGQARP